MRRIIEGHHKNAKNAVLDMAPTTLRNSGNFTIAPVLTSALTVCRRNCGDLLSLYRIRVRYNFTSIRKNSGSGLAWSRPRADRGLSRPTVYSVQQWVYAKCYRDRLRFGRFLSKNRERPSLCLAVNNEK